ncbi:hypothetical protein BU23DRAFT_481776 [Bimuria novae-zelandiae CBS 107.79]|uniref:Myb-like domain-containing protein n=1 Tax=Bimuria novae-zelandiae CBS 107.79 TaxID=1447943 RepID=A0A6A5UVQ7_9PLEO|nr:hypothetical protein BU23DRAFT_481776 [Bimuria novae-zelandiae CBS 107.79]
MSQPSPSSYDVSYQQPPQQQAESNRKRSRADEYLQPLDLPNPLAQHPDPYGPAPGSIQIPPPHPGYPLQPSYQQQHPTPQSVAPPIHHHHRLPNQGPSSSKRIRMAGAPPSPAQPHGPPNVVGQEGMPAPALRPRGPKLKFTPEDDQLLVDLKEKKNLAWKQIADFFPGRSSGTLQVRYCTKLKAKTTVWTDEMVQKLRTAMHEYESDRWRIIASRVGGGFSPAACRDKAHELETGEVAEEDDAAYTQSQLGAAGSSDAGPSFQSNDPNPPYQ